MRLPGTPNDVHPGCHHQERERDDEHRDDRRAPVAEQQEQRGRHQQRAFGEIAFDRRDGGVHELRAVEHDIHLDARRQGLCNLGQLVANSLGDHAAVLADQHERGPDDGFAPVHAGGARAQVAADPDVGDLAHGNRHTPACRHNGIADFIDRTDACISAHEIGLAAAIEVIGADSEIGGFERLGEFAEGNAEAGQLHRIGLDDEGLGIAADRVDTGHAAHALELRRDDPVLHGAQISGLRHLVGEHLPFGRQIAAIGLPTWLAGNPARAFPRRDWRSRRYT
jgi:hypothetical protein